MLHFNNAFHKYHILSFLIHHNFYFLSWHSTKHRHQYYIQLVNCSTPMHHQPGILIRCEWWRTLCFRLTNNGYFVFLTKLIKALSFSQFMWWYSWHFCGRRIIDVYKFQDKNLCKSHVTWSFPQIELSKWRKLANKGLQYILHTKEMKQYCTYISCKRNT